MSYFWKWKWLLALLSLLAWCVFLIWVSQPLPLGSAAQSLHGWPICSHRIRPAGWLGEGDNPVLSHLVLCTLLPPFSDIKGYKSQPRSCGAVFWREGKGRAKNSEYFEVVPFLITHVSLILPTCLRIPAMVSHLGTAVLESQVLVGTVVVVIVAAGGGVGVEQRATSCALWKLTSLTWHRVFCLFTPSLK